jgi:hypothetical protein
MIDPMAYAEAFKATVEATIDGDRLNVYAIPEADPQLPAVILFPGTPFITFRRTFGSGGLAEVRFEAEARVALGEDAAGASMLMYEICGSGSDMSLFDAVTNTLGGVVGDCVAETWTTPAERQTADGRPYLTASLGVTITERRS